MEWNLVWNHTRNFKIKRAHSASSIWNHKYVCRPKLHHTKFNYYFITAILKSQNSVSENTVFYWSRSRSVKKPKQKGFYISFCIRNRNDAIWNKSGAICFPRLIYCDQEPSLLLNVTEDYFLGVHIRLYQLDTKFVSLQNHLAFPSKVTWMCP